MAETLDAEAEKALQQAVLKYRGNHVAEVLLESVSGGRDSKFTLVQIESIPFMLEYLHHTFFAERIDESGEYPDKWVYTSFLMLFVTDVRKLMGWGPGQDIALSVEQLVPLYKAHAMLNTLSWEKSMPLFVERYRNVEMIAQNIGIVEKSVGRIVRVCNTIAGRTVTVNGTYPFPDAESVVAIARDLADDAAVERLTDLIKKERTFERIFIERAASPIAAGIL